jgi:transposase
MPRPRVDMRKIREVLRLTFAEGLSRRQVGAAAGVPFTTVSDYVGRAVAAGVSWPLPDGLDDAGLEALLYPPVVPSAVARPAPDFDHVHKQLRRKNVTLQLLWLEYREDHPDGYGYSQFASLYRRWRGGIDVTMRQVHRAGEKLFVDFPGDTIPVFDRATGEIALRAELFVAVTGASSWLYAEAFPSQELLYWVTAHVHCFEAMAGCPAIVVYENVPRNIFGHDDPKHASEERSRRLTPSDDRRQVLAEAQPDIAVSAADRGEDQGVRHAPTAGPRVGPQAHLPEVDLAFRAWLAVSDGHGGLRGAPAVSQHLQRVAVQGPLRDHHAAAGQQLAGLDHRQALAAEHVLDLLVVRRQHRPGLAVTVRAVRADPLGDLAEQPIAQLPLAARAVNAARLRRRYITADGLAVQPRQPPSGADPLTPQPQPQYLSDLVHLNLPGCHRCLPRSADRSGSE